MEAERLKDFSSKAQRWIAEIDNAEKHQKKWIDRARKVLKRYRDERPETETAAKFNILWANTEVLKPAVYFQTPKPNVSRRFKDRDPVGRQAAMILERALSFSVDAYDFDGAVRSVVEDYLLPGRGTARVRYKADLEKYPVMPDMMGMVPPEAQEIDGQFFLERVKSETSECEYWFWGDLIIPKVRRWQDTPWIAFKAYLKRDKLVERFGEELGSKIPLDYVPEGHDKNSPDTFKQACIYEIWNKEDKKVIWLHKQVQDVLEEKDPPLNLVNFFPIPKPLMAVSTNDTNIPIPLYAMYQDQARELDNLTQRIDILTDALRVAGVYNGEFAKLKDLITGSENKMIPIDGWVMFAEKGGMKGAVDWFPLDQVVTTLISLYDAREKVKQDLYEISGIADIVRGSSDPRETLGAQKLKGRFASLRLEDWQTAVAAFARDLLRLKAEVIADKFSPETLQKMTGLKVTPEVMALLRDDLTRSFRIDIETDSTIRPDEQEENTRRVEFLKSAGEFLTQGVVAAQQAPALAPLMGEMLLFAIRGFKVGRELEEKFEEALQKLQETPPQPPPDPAQLEDQAKAAKIQQDMKLNEAEFIKDQEREDQQHALEIKETLNDIRIDNLKARNAQAVRSD